MDCACRVAFALVATHRARDGISNFPLDIDCLTQAPTSTLPPLPFSLPSPINIKKNVEEVTSTLPMRNYMYHTTLTGASVPIAGKNWDYHRLRAIIRVIKIRSSQI